MPPQKKHKTPEAAGVRMHCPECQWDYVMTAEDEMPKGVSRMEHGVPYCPNCTVAMKPIRSVAPPTADQAQGIPPAPATLTADERLKAICEQQEQVDDAASLYEDAKAEAANAKKEWERQVEALGTLIHRMGAPAPLPLFDGPVPSTIEPPDDDEPLPGDSDDTDDTARAQKLQGRLEKLNIKATAELIRTWTREQVEAATRYVTTLEHQTAPPTNSPCELYQDPATGVMRLRFLEMAGARPGS